MEDLIEFKGTYNANSEFEKIIDKVDDGDLADAFKSIKNRYGHAIFKKDMWLVIGIYNI